MHYHGLSALDLNKRYEIRCILTSSDSFSYAVTHIASCRLQEKTVSGSNLGQNTVMFIHLYSRFLIAGIMISNPAEGICFRLLCLLCVV